LLAMSKYASFIAACLLSTQLILADSTNTAVPEPAANAPAASDDTNAATNSSSEPALSRWFELDAMSFSMRYRNSYDTQGVHAFNNGQQKTLLAGKFKFDKDGKYFVGFRASSGRYFNWSYANFTGLDYRDGASNAFNAYTPQRQAIVLNTFYKDPNASLILSEEAARGWQFYIRDLYLSATPVKGLTFEFGAIPIERGVSSEITTYDEDGYISGERVRLRAPEHLYFDQIAFTTAYLGDVFMPNFFDRYDRLSQWNYRQALLEKNFGSRFKASADFTWLQGTRTMREAGLVRIPETKALDSVRVELYQRLNDVYLPGILTKAADGWSFTASKTFAKRYTVEGGYASIDDDYGVYSGDGVLVASAFGLNGDSYQVGKRFFARADVKLAPFATVFGFYTREIDATPNPLYLSLTRQSLNAGMTLDFKSMLKMSHIL
jgi:hypothetical protein